MLIDCREVDEYALVKIDGSQLYPLSIFASLVEQELSHEPKSKEIIIYCHHGIRSLNATYYLKDQGFTNVKSMQGGIDYWSIYVDQEKKRY